MAIIAVLAGLLLSSLRSSQAQAIRVNCTSNLRQLGVAFQIYVQESGTYPVAMNNEGLGNWQHALWPASTDRVLYCPQQMPASDQFLEYFPTNQRIFPHYGYNAIGAERINPPPQNPGLGGNFVWSGLGVGGYVASAENWVRVPSRMIAFGDGETFVEPPLISGVTLTPADPLYMIFPYILQPQNYYGVNQDHDQGANLMFCDQHVEYAPQTQWLSAADENKRLWNHDNQSHPEFQ